jgi:hypothetical protein
MKRILIIAALAAATLAPAASSADSAGMATTARGGNDLEIKFILSSTPQGKPVQIKNFKFTHFTVACAVGGPVDVKGEIAKMNIKNSGKFDGNVTKGDAKVHVEGEVKQNGNKVEGTLKSSGDFGSGAEDCNTKVNWEAS